MPQIPAIKFDRNKCDRSKLTPIPARLSPHSLSLHLPSQTPNNSRHSYHLSPINTTLPAPANKRHRAHKRAPTRLRYYDDSPHPRSIKSIKSMSSLSVDLPFPSLEKGTYRTVK